MRRLHLGPAALLLGSALLLLGAPARAQECLDCHGQPGSSVSFKDGSSRDITIDPAAWAASVHGAMGASCTDCHTEHSEYPHPDVKAGSARDYTISHYTSCQQCHEDQFKKQLDGVHIKTIAAGNKNAAVCSDCHNPHTQKKITGEDGKLLPEGRVGIPQTCARCHAEIQKKYRASVHGHALVDGNRDVPTCIDCHGVHDIADPRTAAFRLDSPRLCADCHTDAQADGEVQALDAGAADLRGRLPRLHRHPLSAAAPRPGDQQAGLLRLPRDPRHREQDRPEEGPAGEGEPPADVPEVPPRRHHELPRGVAEPLRPHPGPQPRGLLGARRLQHPDPRASWAGWRSSWGATSCAAASTADATSSAGTGWSPHEHAHDLRAPAGLRALHAAPTASSTR